VYSPLQERPTLSSPLHDRLFYFAVGWVVFCTFPFGEQGEEPPTSSDAALSITESQGDEEEVTD